MELLVALITNAENKAQVVVELTQNKHFKRSWSCLYYAISNFHSPRNASSEVQSKNRKLLRGEISPFLASKVVQKLMVASESDLPGFVPLANQSPRLQRNLMAIDLTPRDRSRSNKSPDRGFVRTSNNRFSVPGYEHSVVCMLPEPGWSVPVAIARVKTSENKYTKGAEQIQNLTADVPNNILNKFLNIAVADSGFNCLNFTYPLYEQENLVTITRLRGNRNFFSVFTGKQKAKGRDRKYGEKMNIKNIGKATDKNHVETIIEQTKNGKISIELSEYKNHIIRGKKDRIMSDKPMNFVRVEVFNEDGSKKYNRDLCLAISGKKRQEISVKEAYLYYKRRFDIEHFFKFGKSKLLMDKFQTSSPEIEEDYMMFVMLAYNCLYHAKDQVNAVQFRPWDKKIKTGADEQKLKLTPSQVYRSMASLNLDDITSSVITRGIPTEKNIRRSFCKKADVPVVRKTKVENKLEICIKSTFGKTQQILKTQINAELLKNQNSAEIKLSICSKIIEKLDKQPIQIE